MAFRRVGFVVRAGGCVAGKKCRWGLCLTCCEVCKRQRAASAGWVGPDHQLF